MFNIDKINKLPVVTGKCAVNAWATTGAGHNEIVPLIESGKLFELDKRTHPVRWPHIEPRVWDTTKVEKSVRIARKPVDPTEVVTAFVSKDDSRKVMHGVFHDNGDLVGCDGCFLCVLKGAAYNDEYNGKVVDYKSRTVIDGQYPNYKYAIPPPGAPEHKLDVAKALAKVTAAKKISKLLKIDIHVHHGGAIVLDAGRMFTILSAFAKLGFTEVTMRYDTKESPVVFTAGGALCVLMPIRIGDNIHKIIIGKE